MDLLEAPAQAKGLSLRTFIDDVAADGGRHGGGLDHYLTKPVRLDRLTAALSAAATWRHAHRAESAR